MNIAIQSIQIRDHYPLISAMMQGLHESEKELFNKTDDWQTIAHSYMQHVIGMQEEQNGICLLAFAGADPAGFIFGYEEEEEEGRIEAYQGKDLYVSDGYVWPAYRRLGIYRQLNDKLEALFIARGIRRILRFTLTSNTRMQQFLEAQQYQPVRLLYEKWLQPDGQTIDPLELKPPAKD